MQATGIRASNLHKPIRVASEWLNGVPSRLRRSSLSPARYRTGQRAVHAGFDLQLPIGLSQASHSREAGEHLFRNTGLWLDEIEEELTALSELRDRRSDTAQILARKSKACVKDVALTMRRSTK